MTYRVHTWGVLKCELVLDGRQVVDGVRIQHLHTRETTVADAVGSKDSACASAGEVPCCKALQSKRALASHLPLQRRVADWLACGKLFCQLPGSRQKLGVACVAAQQQPACGKQKVLPTDCISVTYSPLQLGENVQDKHCQVCDYTCMNTGTHLHELRTQMAQWMARSTGRLQQTAASCT